MIPKSSSNDDGWDEWKNAVLIGISEIKTEQKETAKRLSRLDVDVSNLKVKSGMWGAVGGAIPVAILIAFEIIRGVK